MAGEVPHLLAHVHQLPEVGARALGGQVHRGPAGLPGGEAGGGGGPARAGGRGGPALRPGEAGRGDGPGGGADGGTHQPSRRQPAAPPHQGHTLAHSLNNLKS